MFLAFFDHVPTLVYNSKHFQFSGMKKIDFHQYCPIDKIQEDASYRKIEELHATTKNYL